MVAACALALGLPKDADPEDVLAELTDLVQSLSAVPSTPEGSAPDVPPPPVMGTRTRIPDGALTVAHRSVFGRRTASASAPAPAPSMSNPDRLRAAAQQSPKAFAAERARQRAESLQQSRDRVKGNRS
jgi:hypothetical protein